MISIKENQNQCQFPPFTISTDTSSLSCAIRLNPQDQGATHQQQQEIANDLLAVGGTSSQHVPEHSTNGNCNQHIGEGRAQGSAKWMSSKMRLMRKMQGTDQILINKQRRLQSLQEQAQPNQASSSSISNSPTDIIRVCSNCKTTKTPLWRSGPQGPKSLCNACGIRQMKARRAMRAAAAAGLSSGIIPTADCKAQEEEERRSDVDRAVPFKKRFKIVNSCSSQKKKLQFDDITISLSKKLAFHQTFPQEEKDAAILLMALSCGLLHG